MMFDFLDENLLFQGKTLPKCHLDVKEKSTI
jgi:hypothetical protein